MSEIWWNLRVKCGLVMGICGQVLSRVVMRGRTVESCFGNMISWLQKRLDFLLGLLHMLQNNYGNELPLQVENDSFADKLAQEGCRLNIFE